MIIFRGFIIWLIIVFAESLHGTARRFLLEPYIGDFGSRQISVLSGAIIIFAISFAFVRWIRATRKSELIMVGVFWLVLTVLFEITLGKLILEYSWERIFSDYNLFEGGFLSIGLIFMAFSPLIAAKIRGIV
jgi:hypothetical protein